MEHRSHNSTATDGEHDIIYSTHSNFAMRFCSAVNVRAAWFGQAYVVERFGKFHTVLEPGLNIIIPLVVNRRIPPPASIAARCSIAQLPPLIGVGKGIRCVTSCEQQENAFSRQIQCLHLGSDGHACRKHGGAGQRRRGACAHARMQDAACACNYQLTRTCRRLHK